MRAALMSILYMIVFILLPLPLWAQEVIPGEYIVKLRGSPNAQVSQKFTGRLKGGSQLKATLGRLNIHHVSLKGSSQTVEELRADPDVEYVEPNYVIRRYQEAAGVERSFSIEEIQEVRSQSQPSALGTFSQNGAPVQVEAAWAAMSSSSTRPIVAVIDTGVDTSHPIFQGSDAIWTSTSEIPGNGIDDDGNGYRDDNIGWNFVGRNNNPADDEGHGTHVAGIILGVTTDIFASPLTQSPVRIMPLKFLAANGSGATSDAVSAIYYAVNQGARIINCSWGGSTYSQALHDAMAYAYSRGAIVIAAAGNYSSNNDQAPMYPSSLPVPSLVSIAASTSSDALASFSNFGRGSVLMAAPGTSVLSTYPGNQYRTMSGTSMATPFAAGLAALAMREAPVLTGFQVRNILSSAVVTMGNFSGKVVTNGRLDALAVVQSAIAQKSSAPYQPGYVAVAPAGARSPASTAEASGSKGGGGCGTVASLSGAALGRGDGGPSGGKNWGVILSLAAFPMLIWIALQAKLLTKPRRRHDRFVMKSSIRVNVGGRELVGQMQTISQGGLSFEAETMLEKGGVVTLQITSPDGKDQMQVEGRVVWSENNQSYGVQFSEESSPIAKRIGNWTKGLVRT